MALSRPLPLELHEEIHKCLPLPNAIHILKNISSSKFVDINSDRMPRNIQQLKTSLHEYINTLINDEAADREGDELQITDDLQWKPELDALFRYGTWLTTTQQFLMFYDNGDIIKGMPKNFVEELFLHMAYSRSPQMTLHRVQMKFGKATIPIPTFMKPLLNKKKEHYQIGRRILFESIQLEMGNGQILHIFDGECEENSFHGTDILTLFVMNKMDGNNWFRIIFTIDSSKEFIWDLVFSKWNMQSFDVANFVKEEWCFYDDQIEQNGNKLEAKNDINWGHNLDMILRRGAGFTQFRHFEMKQYIFEWHPWDYVDFLISSISSTKHPEDFLESIDMNLDCSSSLIEKFWTIFYKGIPEVGISINLENNKLHILSVKNADNKSEFTLANIPTNGAYLFDVEVKFGKEGPEQIVGIKIQKRKNDGDIMELKCEDQIGFGKKTKAENDNNDDENGPTHSGKLMKQ